MRNIKLIPVSLLGLAINALCNAAYILQIARTGDGLLLAHSMVMWSGFFIAGACVAPFENYFLYTRISSLNEESNTKVVLFSGILFTLVGVSIFFSQSSSFWLIPLSTAIGLCNGKIIYLRSVAISQNKLLRVSISNSLEGIIRFTTMMLMIDTYGKIELQNVIAAYLFGSLFSLLSFVTFKSGPEVTNNLPFSIHKIYTLSAIGVLTASVTGGIPYLAGFLKMDKIPTLLFFFTISRSLLILQSLLVYINPNLAKKIGDAFSLKPLIRDFAILVPITYLALSVLKKVLEDFLEIELPGINRLEIMLYSVALIVGAFLNFRVASMNVKAKPKASLASGIIGFIMTCVGLLFISPTDIAFLFSMIFGPLIALFVSISYEKGSRSTHSNS